MFLIQKYTQYKAAQAEQQKRKVTEKELTQLNHKIDKLLTKLDEHEPEIATNQDEECVVCVNAKATMQTYPCGHRVICRKCFVKTIQTAVAQRLLPLRCVICRAKILRLKHVNGLIDPDDEAEFDAGAGGGSGGGGDRCGRAGRGTGAGAGRGEQQASSPTSASSSSSTSSATSALRQTISHWYKVPQSDSLYSVTSNASRASSSSCASTASSFRSAASSTFASLRKSHSTYSRMGYEQLRNTASSPSSSPSPPSIRKILFPGSVSSKKHHHHHDAKNKISTSVSMSMNAIPKSISTSTPTKDSASKAIAIPTSRSSCQIHGQQQQRKRQPHPQTQTPAPQQHGKFSSNKLPKKENRIVPVQAPKPMSMGLGPGPCSKNSNCNVNSNNNRERDRDRKSPASSPSSLASSSLNSSNNNLTTGGTGTATSTLGMSGTPLKGKFRLVQEFQREFHTGREQCLNQGGKPHYHHHPEGLSNRTVAIGGKFRCSRPSQPRPCHCRDGSGNINGGGRPAMPACVAVAVGLPKDRSIHSISSCVAAIPSSSSAVTPSSSMKSNPLADDVPNCSVPSSQSCPSFKQVLRPPPHSRCHSHYHHHRCGGCGTDKLRKLETLIEVK